MTRILREFRIIPVALIAISALFVLKSLGLVFDGAYVLGDAMGNADDGEITGTILRSKSPSGTSATGSPARRSWAQQMFNFPDVTGSVPSAPKQEPKATKAKAEEPPATPAGTQVPVDGGRVLSPAERAVLERLSERRAELDARARELDMRESLALAAEKRIESRVAQLRQLEAQINESMRVKDENEANRIKSVVAMYENMRPKDAARVFDRLDMRVLVEMATQINPRRMSDILAQMGSDTAERLTVELASRARDRPPAELPRIEGHPTAN